VVVTWSRAAPTSTDHRVRLSTGRFAGLDDVRTMDLSDLHDLSDTERFEERAIAGRPCRERMRKASRLEQHRPKEGHDHG
jgi:hypothetical protein